MTEYFAVHAQGGVPAIGGGPLSARPAPGQPGRVYVSNEGTISRDTGVSWSALSGDDPASILEKLLTVDANDSGLNATSLQGTTLAALVTEAEHTKAAHDALGINAATLGGNALSALLLASQRGAPEGVAELVGGLVPENRIPAVAIGRPYEAASQAAMLALGGVGTLPEPAGVGDVAIRSDINKTFMLRASPASTLANWAELRTPTDAVLSVDGRTGAFSLSDLYAATTDARLRVIRDEGIALTNRPAIDFTGDGVIVSDDSVGGRTQVNISGTAAGSASETAAGIGELGTDVEIQTVLTGSAFRDFLVSVFRLREELDRRLTSEAWIAPTLLNGWSNSPTYDDPTGYYKDALSRVHFRGLITGGTANNIFTLPAGYRPVKTKGFTVPTSLTTDTGRVEVAPTGTVSRPSGINNNLSLAGISFRAGG